MPLYSYHCFTCDHADDEYFKMDAAAPIMVCPKCAAFNYIKQVSLCGTGLKQFHTPIEMYSVAEQDMNKIRDLQMKCPDAKISDDPRDPLYGVPVAPNRQAKLQVLKAQGFVERN